MLDRARGHIVVVSSGRGLRTFPFAAVYGATKSAQRGFAEALRHELSGTGVSLTSSTPARSRATCTTTTDDDARLVPLGRCRAGAAARRGDRRGGRAGRARRLLPARGPPAADRARPLAASWPTASCACCAAAPPRRGPTSIAMRRPRRMSLPSNRRSSPSSRARPRSCRRVTSGATSPSGTASARSSSATATTSTCSAQRQADEPLLPRGRCRRSTRCARSASCSTAS